MIIRNYNNSILYNSFSAQTFYISSAKQAPYAIYISTNSTHAWDNVLGYYDSYETAEQGFLLLYDAFAQHAPVFAFDATNCVQPRIVKNKEKKTEKEK